MQPANENRRPNPGRIPVWSFPEDFEPQALIEYLATIDPNSIERMSKLGQTFIWSRIPVDQQTLQGLLENVSNVRLIHVDPRHLHNE